MFFLALVIINLFVVSHISFASQIVVENKCLETIWPAIYGRDPQASPGQSAISFDKPHNLSTNQMWKTVVPDTGNVTGRLWPRTGCQQEDGESLHCRTGDCAGNLTCLTATAGNTTLVEFYFEEPKSAMPRLVYYDLSLGTLHFALCGKKQ